VCAKLDDITGQAIYAFVTLRADVTGSEELANQLRDHVAEKLGKFTRPKYITFTPELPKTRSGKIMRRLLRDIAEGRALGDTTTLADSNVVSQLQTRAREEAGNDEG
jgi:acetyl-CoA synthetase